MHILVQGLYYNDLHSEHIHTFYDALHTSLQRVNILNVHSQQQPESRLPTKKHIIII